MKTKEFIEEARDLGLFVEENENQNIIWIKTPYEDSHVGEVKTNKIGCRIFDESKRFPGISKLIYEYGMAPLEEREEEEKYRYKFKPSVKSGGGGAEKIFHLARFSYSGDLTLDASGINYAKSSEAFHFTDKQVEEFTDEQKLLIQLCEKIEVTP